MQSSRFKITREMALAAFVIILIVGFTIRNPQFFSLTNLFYQLTNATTTWILALAILPVMITGGIDLSFMVIFTLSRKLGLMLAQLISPDPPVIIILFCAALVGASLSLFNCLLITKFRIPPIITTIATAQLFTGIQNLTGQGLMANTNKLTEFVNASLFEFVNEYGQTVKLKVMFLIPVVMSILLFLFLKYTIIGRSMYAVGSDRDTARRNGINVPLTMATAYIILGAVVGMFGTLRAGIGVANSVGTSEFNIIVVVILGGLTLGGGGGTVLGTTLAAVIMTLLQNNTLLLGLPQESVKTMIGIVMIVALIFTSLDIKKKGVSEGKEML